MTKIGEWEDKVWGRTQCTASGGFYSHHKLEITKGGFCSLHFHRHRGNLFKVQSGVVRVVRCYAWQIEVDVLYKGDELIMPALVPHQFHVIESGTMEEEYFPWRGQHPIALSDIERLTEGGLDWEVVYLADKSVILSNGQLWDVSSNVS